MAARNQDFKPLVMDSNLPSKEISKGLASFIHPTEKITSITLPGASLCGYRRFEDSGMGNYLCATAYDSEQSAYAGWKEAVALVTGSRHWQIDIVQVDWQLSKTPRTSEMSDSELKIVQKEKTCSRICPEAIFKDPDLAAVVYVTLGYKGVVLKVSNTNLPAAIAKQLRDETVSGLANEASDQEFGRKLKRLMDASLVNFATVKGEYDIRKGAAPL
jgi:hypothetical protein